MKNIIKDIRQSLSLKLSLGIMTLVMPIFLVSLAMLFIQSRHNIRQAAMERAATTLDFAALRVARYLNVVETATNNTSWQVEENLNPDSLLAYSRRILLLNPDLSGCSITTEPDVFSQYGRYFSAYSVRTKDSVSTVIEGKYEYFEKPWYKIPRMLDKPCWIAPSDDYNEGTLSNTEIIASYSKPLHLADGRLVGIMSTDVSLRQLSEVILSEQPYPHSYFVMLGKDGHYLIHPDTTRLFLKSIYDDEFPDRTAMGEMEKLMNAGTKGILEANIDGTDCHVCIQPLPNTPWSLALVCPDSDVLQGYYRLTNTIVPIIIIGLIIILILCRLMVNHATSPIKQLLYQSQQIAAGHYDCSIAKSRRKDVVGQLQNSFADMQRSLAAHVSSIEQLNKQAAQRNDELLQANELVQQSLEQKTAFIQNVTHQIRTPLNIIMGFAQVLGDNNGSLSDQETNELTAIIDHNTHLLSRMVFMLFDSSETGKSEEQSSGQQYEQVACNEVARESISQTLTHFPGLSIALETSLPDSFRIRANRLLLLRSLREMLYNSAKYSDGKHIVFKVSQTPTGVRFIFTDTGPGIPPDYRSQMFVPFSKHDDLSEGLGLGLSLSRRHIMNMGGSLQLDENYHDGCRIIIDLPKSEKTPSNYL